jgi:predicted O-methyltransferase YrrM
MVTLREATHYFATYAELLAGCRPSTPDAAVQYCLERPIRPQQVQSEITELARRIQAAAPRCSLEIGTNRGGTLFLLCTLSPPDSTIVSIDLPGGRFGGGYAAIKIPLFRRFAKRGQRLRLIRADSHLPATRQRILQILDGVPLDFLFIDGDHTYEGVRRDFDMYASLVRRGGLIVFHDIVEHPPQVGCEVATFWQEIKERYKYWEIIESPNQGWAGLGVLVVS